MTLKNNRYLVDESSEDYRVINTPFILNTYIEKKENDVVIYVENLWTREVLQDRIQLLSDYYKKAITIIVDETLFSKDTQTEDLGNTVKKEGILRGYLIEEYLNTPYFIGESNRFVVSASENFISDTNSQNILFIYGGVGVGKSHIMHKIAHRVVINGKNVYLNNSNAFLEEIKSNFGKSKSIYRFIRSFGETDYCIVDDIQKLNSRELSFASDILFEILNIITSKGKKAIFSSDVSPYMFELLHDRIRTRLLSGYVCEIKIPDETVKEQYITYYSEKHGVPIPEDIKKYIVESTRNIREVKMFLNISEMLHQSRELNMEQLIRRTPRSIIDIKKIANRDKIYEVFEILKSFFNVSSTPVLTGRKKRDVVSGKIDSIAYYVLQDKLPKHELQQRLQIQSKHHSYFYNRGSELFKSLPRDVQIMINEIVGERIVERA